MSNKRMRIIIILAGFLNWIFAAKYIPKDIAYNKAIIHLIGAIGFFLVALILRSFSNNSHYNGKAVIWWISFLIYLFTDSLIPVLFHDLNKFNLLFVIVPIFSAFGTYILISKIFSPMDSNRGLLSEYGSED